MSKVDRKSSFVLFLDIDGVLNKIYDKSTTELIVKNAFPQFPTPDHNYICSKAAALSFNTQALENLNQIIEQAKMVAEPKIVISSNWRKTVTVRQLRKIFDIHSFSKYIIDKTPESLIKSSKIGKKIGKKPHCKTITPSKLKKALKFEHCYHTNVISTSSRADEIQFWIDNRGKPTSNFAILDDKDDGLSKKFGKRFIQTTYKELVTSQIVDKVLKLLQAQGKSNTSDELTLSQSQSDTSDEENSSSPRD